MEETKILHFDSALLCNPNPLYNDPFNASFVLANPIKGIKKVFLKSIEMPVSFNNIRDVGTLNEIIITVESAQYTITLPSNNYTSISTLLTNINTAFSAAGLPSGDTITFSLNGNNIKVVYYSPTKVKLFSIKNTQLSNYILGIKPPALPVTELGSSVIYASAPYHLSIDNYVIMYISNIGAENNSASGALSTFKIGLNATNGVVFFNSEVSGGFQQGVNVTSTNNTLTNLSVAILDRFGNQLLNGNDYSFTLAFVVDK